MKNIKLFLAFVAILVGSFIGVAGADLPFGKVAWANHVATNSFTTVVQVVHYDLETGDEIVFYPGQEGTKFVSYQNFIAYLKMSIAAAEINITDENGYDPNKPLLIYITTVVNPANTSPVNRGFNDFIWFEGKMIRKGNHWTFPADFIDSLEPGYDEWQVLPLKKGVASAKVWYHNKKTGLTDEQDSEGANGFPERLVKVNNRGSVLLRNDLVVANPDYELLLTVRYKDGKTEVWNEMGKNVSEAPVATLTTLVSRENSGVELLLTGALSQRVTIQKFTEGGWVNYKTVLFTNTIIRIPHDPGTNEFEFFRIID